MLQLLGEEFSRKVPFDLQTRKRHISGLLVYIALLIMYHSVHVPFPNSPYCAVYRHIVHSAILHCTV